MPVWTHIHIVMRWWCADCQLVLHVLPDCRIVSELRRWFAYLEAVNRFLLLEARQLTAEEWALASSSWLHDSLDQSFTTPDRQQLISTSLSGSIHKSNIQSLCAPFNDCKRQRELLSSALKFVMIMLQKTLIVLQSQQKIHKNIKHSWHT